MSAKVGQQGHGRRWRGERARAGARLLGRGINRPAPLGARGSDRGGGCSPLAGAGQAGQGRKPVTAGLRCSCRGAARGAR
eukprot:9182435-Alexandrium_andersonii.AAC.1